MKKIFLLVLVLLLSFSSVFACKKEIDVNYNNGIYHIVLDGKKLSDKIKFVSSENLISNRKAHQIFNSLLTINTGYFDPKNQKTISYIIEDNKILNPRDNENLMNNPILVQNMDKIENRTEFRILNCNGKTKYDITPHMTSIPQECTITNSAQGGPMIIPDLRLEEEFFIVKNSNGKVIRESASVLHKCARTIIGLKGQDIHILIFTNDHPLDMLEVQQYCKDLHLDKAMGFDGGSSTSFNYNDIEVVSAKNSGRLLKSFMIITK
jgi:exopolysaccharide biosynthesis protein